MKLPILRWSMEPPHPIGNATPLNMSLVTAHSVSLSGLQANTTYNYRVKSRDAAGNLAASGNLTFVTPTAPPPADTTSPVLSSISSIY